MVDPSGRNDLTARIVALLDGMALLDADRVLDDVRRILYAIELSGKPLPSINPQARDALAFAIAHEFDGMAFGDQVAELEIFRLRMWRSTPEPLLADPFAPVPAPGASIN